VQLKETNMKTTFSKWGAKAAGAGAIALLLATPSFAQSRGGWNRSDNSNRGRQSSGARNDSRENQRVETSGQISSFSRERDGYRVQLDRGRQSYWVPQSSFGNRARDLRSGLSISLGGVFRGGTIYVDAVSWPDQYGRGGAGRNGYGYGNDNGYIRGVVDRVDYRSGTLWLRDDASGRLIAADMNAGNRYGRSDVRGLRRGDYVELTGQWIRGGVFEVARIDNVRTGRY
jgi:hypothetical protein